MLATFLLGFCFFCCKATGETSETASRTETSTASQAPKVTNISASTSASANSDESASVETANAGEGTSSCESTYTTGSAGSTTGGSESPRTATSTSTTTSTSLTTTTSSSISITTSSNLNTTGSSSLSTSSSASESGRTSRNVTSTEASSTPSTTAATTTSRPLNCSNTSTLDGYEFFSRTLTLIMTNRTYDASEGLQRLRCERSEFVSANNSTHEIKRYFYYKDLRAYRKVIVGESFSMPRQSGALYRMTYYENGTGKYDYMNSTQLNSFADYALLPPKWRHLYTEENCTVVQVLSSKRNIKSGDTVLRSQNNKVHCELWEVDRQPDYKIENDSITIINEPKTSDCCEKVFREKCLPTLQNAADNECYRGNKWENLHNFHP